LSLRALTLIQDQRQVAQDDAGLTAIDLSYEPREGMTGAKGVEVYEVDPNSWTAA
jgi:hypothetical protein